MTTILHWAMFSRRNFGDFALSLVLVPLFRHRLNEPGELGSRLLKKKQTNKQKTDKTKQKEDELPLHTHLEIAHYVPL